MFAFQNKRQREDDSDSEDNRCLKRTRQWTSASARKEHNGYPSPSSFAYRPSLPPSPPRNVPNLEAMTPSQSDYSDANSPASVQDEQFVFSSPTNAHVDMDMDMDEDLDTVRSQPPDSPFLQGFLRPAKLNAELFGRDSPANNTGRIPTPIYPTFSAQRGGSMNTGGMGGLAYPNSGFAGGLSSNYLNAPNNPVLQPPPHARKQAYIDQDRTRRMPSPISEDEDIPDTPTALTQSQLSRLSMTSNGNYMEHMDMEGRNERGDADMMAPPPGVVTTPTRGRKRSGALSGRGRFSMGYRDDCEKCRQRVPGHYSHFLPSETMA